jgi:hypothetical protein
VILKYHIRACKANFGEGKKVKQAVAGTPYFLEVDPRLIEPPFADV